MNPPKMLAYCTNCLPQMIQFLLYSTISNLFVKDYLYNVDAVVTVAQGKMKQSDCIRIEDCSKLAHMTL